MAVLPSFTQLGPRSILGHFKLTELIGSGGMGLVFKAVDTRLDRTVAIKVLSPELFKNKVAKARFLREAKIAASFTHHNVATIHEIDEYGGMPFIVMELVPGSTLKDMACSNPLPLREVLSIGKQVCDALEASHELGIIHRDIKSSNIMVKPDGQIKVLDFGLAKALEGPPNETPSDGDELTKEKKLPAGALGQSDFVTTAHGVALGTPSYMSPEQAAGTPLDPRTDVFSLGVVLYEAVSGRLPFEGKTDHELLDAIRSRDPKPLQLNDGKVPRDFSKVLSVCLSKEPSGRYQSAPALRDALSLLEKKLGWKQTVIRWMYQTVLGRAAVAVALLILMATLIRWPPAEWLRRGANVPAGTKIVLADLDNRTNEPQLGAVQALLETQLRQSSHTTLVQRADIKRTLQAMVVPRDRRLDAELAREVAWRLGSALVVSAALLRVGTNYAVTVRLDRIGDSPEPEAIWSKDFRAADQDGLYDAVDDASFWIRQISGEAAEQIEALNTPARDATTSSWEALDLFSRAEEAQYTGRNDDARSLLKQAVAVDPDFAMAWGRLADISYFSEQDMIFAYHQKALDAMQRRRLTKYEELRLKAVHAIDSHDFRHAAGLFQTFALTYPRDFVALAGHAFSLSYLGRQEEALSKFVEAVPQRPGAFVAYANAAESHLALGRFQAAKKYTSKLREMGFDDVADYIDSFADFLQGNYDDAVHVLEVMTQNPSPMRQNDAQALLASILGEMGRLEEAQRTLAEGISFDLSAGRVHSAADKHLALAYLHYRSGREQDCLDACLEAIALDKGVERLMRAGSLMARVGALEDAELVESILPDSSDIPLYIKAKLRVRGEILLARGEVRKAIEIFKRLHDMDSPIHETSYLGRALVMSGDLEGAHKLHKQTSDSKVLLWTITRQAVESPGLWADSLYRYARLSENLGLVEESKEALSQYLTLRENADSGLEDVAAAKALWEELTRQTVAAPIS